MTNTNQIITIEVNANWVTLEKYCKMTGETPNAVYCRVSKGIWKRGVIVKTINRRIRVNMIEYDKYCNEYNEKLAA